MINDNVTLYDLKSQLQDIHNYNDTRRMVNVKYRHSSIRLD